MRAPANGGRVPSFHVMTEPQRGWAALIAELQRLRVTAGGPSLREIARRGGPHAPAVSTMSETLNGKRDQVSWEFVRGFAHGCDSYARDHRRRIPPAQLAGLRELWDRAATGALRVPESSPPVASESPLGGAPPAVNLPPRNPDFVGRRSELAELRATLDRTGAAVLTGAGGMGKSQTALEYAHVAIASYRIVWWCDAEQADLLVTAYADLAGVLGCTSPSAELPLAHQAALRHLAGTGDWLLIFDNAADPEALLRWWPAGRGHVLITSRNPDWTGLASKIPVLPLDRTDAVALLRTFSADLTDGPADALAAALGDLPLGLAQAGRYLTDTGSTVPGFLSDLAADPTAALDVGRPVRYPASLTHMVRLAASRMPAVGQWPWLVAELGPDPVPTALLRALDPPHDPPTAALVRSGLVVPVADGLQMHRLTQAVLREARTAGGRLRTRVHAAYDRVLDGDHHDPATWPLWARVIPHVLAARPQDTDDPVLARAGVRAARYLTARGSVDLAADLAHQLRTGCQHRFGPDAELTRAALQTEATALRLAGRPADALPLNEQLHGSLLADAGPDDPDTLWAAHDLAWTYRALGRLSEARDLGEDTLRRRIPVIGATHLLTLGTLNNLANVHAALGSYDRARDLLHTALAGYRRTVGPEHPDALMAALNLATYDVECGRAEAALPVIEANLALRSRHQGSAHPDTLLAAVNLVEVLLSLGENARARKVIDETLPACEQALGPDHPETLFARGLMASVIRAEGDLDTALRLRRQVLADSIDALGPDHPDTMAVRRQLAEDLASR